MRSSTIMRRRREWEEREARKAVTDWQLARYFEII
jgi:glutamine synthetase